MKRNVHKKVPNTNKQQLKQKLVKTARENTLLRDRIEELENRIELFEVRHEGWSNES